MSGHVRSPVLAAILSIAFAVPGAGQQLEAPLPLDPSVTAGTLANGLRYYIRVNREPAQRAELRLVVNAGSVLEDEDQDRKSTRLNSSHVKISYAVFCLKK